MRRIEKLRMTEPAERAVLPVGAQHPQPEGALVEPLPGGDRDVFPPRVLRSLSNGFEPLAYVLGVVLSLPKRRSGEVQASRRRKMSERRRIRGLGFPL